MSLANFIVQNVDAILSDWEAFAHTLRPAAASNTELALRSHAKEILLAIARDIDAAQTDAQQEEKSKGWAPVLEGRETAAATHGALRHLIGFDLRQLTAEYRALRASVIRLWRNELAVDRDQLLTEMTRFNEAIDQALAESVGRYSDEVARSRDTFLAILGHDLRGPLSAVSMSANYLAIPGKVRTEEAPVVLRIRQSVLTMNLMIKDLLEYTRTQLGVGIPIVPAPCDLGHVCENAHDEVQAAHPQCVFDLEMEGDLRGQFDGARLGQVLSNLLNNAVQHGDVHLPVILMARGARDHVMIQVTNFGSPITANAMQVIFNPLVQVPVVGRSAADPMSTSLGLGLFIAREIVTGHGGTVGVSSSGTEGTIFTIRLPRRIPANCGELPK